MPADPLTMINDAVRSFVGDRSSIAAAREAARIVPEERLQQVDEVFSQKARSYKDALLIQLAFGLAGEQNLTMRSEGARTVAGRVGKLLQELHIPAVPDALQNIGKNSPLLTRGNLKPFDDLLSWVSACTEEAHPSRTDLLNALFRYTAARIAETAREVLPLPEVDRAKLNFNAVLTLFESLLAVPSGGAYQQFCIAALLHALVEQNGPQGYRVETKKLNASDRSSRTAGDVQILSGALVVEAFEVTANEWESKLGAAEQNLRAHDLGRIHIVAEVPDLSRVAGRLAGMPDISVVDLKHLCAGLIMSLRKQFRASALERLYEFLDRYQPDPALVNAYVRALGERGLTTG